MKNNYFLISFVLLVCLSGQLVAQKNVGIGTVSPNNSALLEIQSTEKGLLIPRMSLEQRDAIENPAVGLMIYQLDSKNGFYFYNGKEWATLNSNYDAKSVAATDLYWNSTGNAGSDPTVNYLGTSDNQPLIFKVNGRRAGYLGNNTNSYIGYLAGEFVSSTKIGNTAVGTQAFNQGSGNNNTAIGNGALQVTQGDGNVALGTESLLLNTAGNYNMAIGTLALRNNINGTANVAIGTSSLASLSLDGSFNTAIGFAAGLLKNGSGNVYIGNSAGQSAVLTSESNKLYISNSNTETPLVYGDFSAKYVTIGDVTPSLRTQGTATGGYNLLVKGGILTEKVKVALAAPGTDWADYVFEPEYKSKMMSLEEVEKFTLKNKHLPNVPSAEEMVKSGLDVSQTSKMFMEKIEELTLYMIELNKEVKALKAENELLKRK